MTQIIACRQSFQKLQTCQSLPSSTIQRALPSSIVLWLAPEVEKSMGQLSPALAAQATEFMQLILQCPSRECRAVLRCLMFYQLQANGIGVNQIVKYWKVGKLYI